MFSIVVVGLVISLGVNLWLAARLREERRHADALSRSLRRAWDREEEIHRRVEALAGTATP